MTKNKDNKAKRIEAAKNYFDSVDRNMKSLLGIVESLDMRMRILEAFMQGLLVSGNQSYIDTDRQVNSKKESENKEDKVYKTSGVEVS